MFRSTILIAALVASTPSLAEPADTEVRTEIVRYGDLDLDSAAGRTTLDRRIAGAARRVCSEPGNDQLMKYQVERSCRAAAIADAHQQVRTVTVELALSVPVKRH